MQAGDRVRQAGTGEEGVVTSVSDGSLLIQVAFAQENRLLSADDLEKVPQDPDERLAFGDLGSGEPYQLRLQALYLKHAYRYDPLVGLSSARIEPQLHQVYIAHRVTQKLQPRMILADEVGLGKTIEAGLIIKELRARELVSRVLIVVPASLQMQWQSELKLKFNEDFEIIDGAAAQHLGRGGANPWMARQNVICSLPFATSPRRTDQIIEAEWDMVIFDEAHRVRRTGQGGKSRATLAYRLADELKDIVNGLLLLTATPMQLHPFELYSLIELVEPGLFPTYGSYDSRRGFLPQLNRLMRTLTGWNVLSPEEQAAELSVSAEMLGELGLTPAEAVTALSDDHERDRVMDLLVEKHPLAQAIVRNRKAEVGGFTSRDAHTVPVELDADELVLYQEVATYLREGYNRAKASKNHVLGLVMVTYQKMLASSSHAIRQSFGRRIVKLRQQLRATADARARQPSESQLEELRDAEEATAALGELEGTAVDADGLMLEIAQLEQLVERLGKVRDSKAAELLAALDQIFDGRPHEKVVIFTQFIETQMFLAAALRQNGFSVSVFNGQLGIDEKEESVRRFRDADQILISTEAGGEGRNFQFCHLMVNYDLPWNPMKVEQRIGRLDRFGQKRPVHIYNLFCAGTIEERVLDVLTFRIGLFEESVGSLDPILGEVERDIERLVLSDVANFDAEFGQYEETLERRVRQAREKERTLADFVLDRASLRRDTAWQLLRESPLARWTDLERYADACLAYYGGTIKDHYEGGKAVALSPRLLARLGQRQGTVRGTFDPELAREHEELAFFAFGHWLVDILADLPLSVDPASTGARRSPDVPAGEWAEVYYQIRSEGIRPTGRFIRHLIGPNLNVESVELKSVPTLGEPLSRHEAPSWAAAAITASRRQFETEFRAARADVQADNEAAMQEALERARRIFSYRRDRLANRIEEQETWIREKTAAGSDRDRRILPARRGQLAKSRERLSNLEIEHEVEVEAIANRRPTVSAAVLAAGVAIGS